MKSRLKTLKNFDFSYPEISDDEYQKVFDHEKKEELRIEAIKWIKHYGDLSVKLISEGIDNSRELGKKDVLIEFFNITTKDLK